MESVLQAFGLNKNAIAEQITSGLINQTWKIIDGDRQFILQRINQNIFLAPSDIHYNIKQITNYLCINYPDYTLAAPLTTLSGQDLIKCKDGCYRLFHFVHGSHTINTVATVEQAYQAASQFGKFTYLLSGFDTRKLKITIPDFHNLPLRYEQFTYSLKTGNKKRIREAKPLIDSLIKQTEIVVKYNELKSDPTFKLRVIHHDAKISNVLFDNEDKGIGVIDLDTVMPGYFISDVGDMMRTYLSPVNEEERDIEKIEIKEDFYNAIVQGYCSYMGQLLTEKEQQNFFYAGKFMIYMQALRFLTDYVSDDIYYGSQYEGQNLCRANNQIVLLNRLIEKMKKLTEPLRCSVKIISKNGE